MIFSSLAFSLVEKNDEKFDIPIREHSIIISEQGYFPSRISIFTGEKLKIFLASLKDKPSCLFIKSKNVFLSVNGREIIESEIYFDTPGEYEFSCPSEATKGRITVLQRNGGKKKDTARSIASESNNLVKVWMPKENP